MLEQEVGGLKELLEAAEVELKKDDEEWRKDYSALKEQLDSLKEANEELQKDKKLLEHEVDDLKDRVKAAELAFEKDDEEWRQDYYKIGKENESLKEETDSLKQEVESLRQEKDTLKIENEIKEENEASHQNHVEAVLFSHKKDHEEWSINYQSLSEKCGSLKAKNDKLLKQQLEVALIGRRTAIEEMETSLQTTQQEIAVLKVVKEEADKEIMLLNNDKSMLNQKVDSLEEQLQNKEKELIIVNETANRELAEVKARLVSVVEENQRLQQSVSVELHSKKQWLLSQQSLHDQITRARAENERVHQINGELLNKTNALQSELLSTKAQLALQKEQDAKLIHTKSKKEEELKATVDKLNQKIELLEEECVRLKQIHSISTRINHSPHSKTDEGIEKFTSGTQSVNSKETDKTSNKLEYLLAGSPMQSLSASLYQSRSTTKSNETTSDHPVPQATASLKLRSISNVVDQDSLVSNSMPSLCNSNTSSTPPLYGKKTVSTADGEDAVMCKQFIDVADLFCGQRVIIQRTNDSYEYGVVRAFPEYINGNMNFVGIELDLPSMFSQVAT